ncbi:hypothetical protein ACS0TY_031158 [Phlomoides rotata]
MGGFVFKEKLKRLKVDLKIWNREVFGSLDIEDRRKEIHMLDLIDEVVGLDEHEIELRNRERAWLSKDIQNTDSLLCQKSRAKWIKEGDANTGFFHRCINRRRKNNEIVRVYINGEWKEEVEKVKNGIFDFFKTHFGPSQQCRLKSSLDFARKKVSVAGNQMFTAAFTGEEVKYTIDQ